ncbi:MAG: carboxypeptidase regulatory-like domain-containing protein, partial [Fimbriimonadales bacterium]|nr:carboxypeptidase regulatory-like domain-containing protein [Fimbriimonadales bacterium]
MIRRWQLLLAGLLLTLAGNAQSGAGGVTEPYKDRPSRHILPNARPQPIPPQNYKVAPSRAPQTTQTRWRKNGLFDPQQFHQQLQQRQQRTRAPRWDRDITNAAPDEIHPIYNPGATKMFFASNAGGVGQNGRLINPTPRYRIWRGDLDQGSQLYLSNLTNLTPVTGDTPDEQFGSQIHPTINTAANLLAYANRSAAGSYNIVVRNLTTGQRVTLTSDNNGITQNLRPTLSPGGNLVIFSSNRLQAGETEADRRYRLYVARVDGRPFEDGTFFRRITFPSAGEHDVEPAWSPDGNRIAFARIAPDGSSYIYMLDFNTLVVSQWTNFVDSSNNKPRDRQPAWTRIGTTPVLVFASTRKSGSPHRIGEPADRVDVTNNIYDIYRVNAELAEPLGGPVIALTADPSTAAQARPDVPGVTFFTPAAGAKYPTGAIAERNRVAYHSTRTQGAESPGPGVHDLWETLVFDQTPPTMDILPVVTPKESFPGDTVTIRVRAVDLQSGIDFVRVQFKDPDSAEQDAEGLEHRLYQLFQFDIFFPNRILVAPGQAYVPLFVEVGQQAIHPQTYEYKEPYSLARLGFGGSLDDTLQLQPELDSNGNPTDWFVAQWRTPDVPSDFYLDVIVRDNAGNEFIYDNISGFTTQQFTGSNNILLVADYVGGQIFVQNRVDAIGNSITRPTWQPVESYWTDNPTGKPPFDLTQPPSGDPLIIHGDGAIPHPNLPPGFFLRSDTLGQNTTYGNLYNIWRVQCRNPITPSVLAGYQPRIEREPTDLTGGFRDKLHATRIVIWASPYAGNVWAGPGHILDPEVQTLLRSFLQNSGRMVFSGQDIAWALSLRGAVANQFMNDVLRVSFDSDTADDVFFIPYRGLRHILVGEPAPEGEDPNPIANNPGGIVIWVRLEGNSAQPDEPSELRLSHPAEYLVLPDFDTFDVIVPVGAGSGPLYTDAAWNQVWLDTVTVNSNARIAYRYTQPRVNQGTLLGTSNHAGSYYADSATRSKVAFLAFGVEGVNSAYNDGPTIGGQGTLWCRAYRNKIIHNAFGWMTHSVLQGTVRQYDPDTRTFTPLPRALVRVQGIAPISIAGVNAGFAITDSNGFYRIVGLEAGAYVVDAERPGFKTQHPETIVLVAETGTVNLIMLATPPGQISGRVIDINNQPVRGAVVRATSTDDPELTIEVFTDPDGAFLIPRVPVGTWNVTVVSLAFGGYSLPPVVPTPDGVYRNVRVQPGQTTNVGDFVLEPEPGTVTGTVTDAQSGLPIAGARVRAVVGNNTRADVTTDANGQYTFNVPAGQYVVTAVAPGYAPESQSLTVPANQTTTLNFQLSLLPPGSVTGKITRRFGGAPEPGVEVRLLFGGSPVQTTTTNASGDYSFPSVPPGEYIVLPIKSGFTFTPNQRTITVNPSQNTVVGEFKSEPLRTFFRGRFLVSAPYDYTQDVQTLLSVPTGATFRFFSWNPSASRYVFYPNAPANRFELGRGYFLETSVDLPLATQGTAADTNQPFQIPLQAGWNLIGNPFTFDVNWSAVQFIDPDTNSAVSLPTAVGKGIVANALWGYSFGAYTATTRMR